MDDITLKPRDLARVRLSWSFFLSDFLWSPAAAAIGCSNVPEQVDLAVIAGRELATRVLEQLASTFGAVRIRQRYLAPRLAYRLLDCGIEVDAERVWDRFDEPGRMRAGATVALPWLLDHNRPREATAALAVWIRANLAAGEVSLAGEDGVLHIVWRQGARADPSVEDSRMFEGVAIPALRPPLTARRHDLWPPA